MWCPFFLWNGQKSSSLMQCSDGFSKCPDYTNISYSLAMVTLSTFFLLLTSIVFTPLPPTTCLGRGFEFTLGESSKVTHPILISCDTLFLKAMQFSMLWPVLPAWYSQVNSGLYQVGKGGCIGGNGRGAICPILSNLAYNSFRVIGKGGNCSSSCRLSLLW
jgi:hypothetical protein